MEMKKEDREEKQPENLLEWANISDTEFYFRYLSDADEKELMKFLEMFPEFMEDDCQL